MMFNATFNNISVSAKDIFIKLYITYINHKFVNINDKCVSINHKFVNNNHKFVNINNKFVNINYKLKFVFARKNVCLPPRPTNCSHR